LYMMRDAWYLDGNKDDDDDDDDDEERILG
jgi:hypothetical protein